VPDDVARPAQQVDRNIAAIAQLEKDAFDQRSTSARWFSAIGHFAGSARFLLWQSLVFVGWLLVNTLSPTLRFDPYPHHWLVLALALETIFVSTFVLIKQREMEQRVERRAHLTLQFNLLIEAEMTKVLNMLHAMRTDLGVPGGADDAELRDLAARTEVGQVAQLLDEGLNPPAEG
jgi:uncharacterized membrane protein